MARKCRALSQRLAAQDLSSPCAEPQDFESFFQPCGRFARRKYLPAQRGSNHHARVSAKVTGIRLLTGMVANLDDDGYDEDRDHDCRDGDDDCGEEEHGAGEWKHEQHGQYL